MQRAMPLGVHDPSAARRIRRLLPLCVLLACCFYAAGFWCLGGMPTLDLQPAAEAIRRDIRTGDTLAVLPWWAARVREHLGELPWVQVRDLAAEDLSRFARLWLLRLPGHFGDLGGPFQDGRYRQVESRKLGGLRLELWDLPEPARVGYDFRAELRQAQVTVAARPSPRHCASWIEDRWVCSPRDWNYVGRMIVELGDDPREVIWAHPSDEGPIEIRYSQVPGGQNLLVHTGLTPPAARTPDGAPVTLAVEVAGRPLARLVQPNQTGRLAHSLPISDLGPGPHPVVFRISSPHAGMRHFCFSAEVRR